MVVMIGKRAYKMSKKESQKFLKQMSSNVPFGIYAVEKNGTIEMRYDKCKSRTKLKELKRAFKQQGYKVYSNTGD